MTIREIARPKVAILITVVILAAMGCASESPTMADEAVDPDSSVLCLEYKGQPASEAPPWRDVPIGDTTLEHVILNFGEPSKSFEWESKGGATLGCRYVYSSPDELVTFLVANNKVVGIEANSAEVLWSDHPMTLVDAIHDYGRPSIVGWSSLGANYRVTAWPAEGILTTIVLSDDGNYGIVEILFFPKMSVEAFESSIWSEWVIDTIDNIPLDMLDPWPQDPFDWEDLESND